MSEHATILRAGEASRLATQLRLLANLELRSSVEDCYRQKVAAQLAALGFDGLAETLPRFALEVMACANVEGNDRHRERWRRTLLDVGDAVDEAYWGVDGA